MANVKPKTDVVIVGLGWTGSILAKELTDAGLNVVALERGPDRDTQPDFSYPRVVDELEGSVHRRYLLSLQQETVTVRHSPSDIAVPYRQMGSFKPEWFYKAASEMGWHPYPIPASNASRPYTNPYGCQMGPCNFCGFCSDYGCLNYSKGTPNVCVLPAVRRSGRFELRAHSQVLKVNLDGTGKKATGVTYLGAQGRETVQEADLVLLCAFSLYNVHLMLVSGIGTPYDPETNTGTIGRNYSYQNLNRVVLFFGKDVQANGFIGNGGAGTTMDDLNGKQLDNAAAGFVGGGIIWARQPGSGPVRGINVPPGTPGWGSPWKQAITDSFRHSFYYEVQGACTSYRQHYLSLDPTYKDAFGRPLLRMTFDWHDNEIKASQFLVDKAMQMSKVLDPIALSGDAKKPGTHYNITNYQSTHTCGGAIMGDNPKTSALNRYLQSWDVPNVFVIGANAFPQNNGYNPTGLVGGLAYWAAAAIRELYLKNPGPLVQA
jgi:gluconate 2-dehydrogenase alpha chain